MISKHKLVFPAAILVLLLVAIGVGTVVAQGPALTPKEELGQFLYFDEDLSEPSGQSCASCHDPDFGFVDPDKGLPVSEGVIPDRFGGRNSPAAAYAMYAPIFYFDEDEELWIGGQFWDGRATGYVLGDPLAHQALGPFLNEVEMNNPDKATVVIDAINGSYGELFIQECVDVNLPIEDQVDAAYDCVALSIAAFERTQLFGQFSSKYDYYLKTCMDMSGLPDDCAVGSGAIAESVGTKIFSKKEWAGMQLFMDGEDGGAKCVLCHVADWTEDPGNVVVPDWSPDGSIPPLFTDFTYDNLGVPKSEHRLLVDNATDLGLADTLEIMGEPFDGEEGKFKVMTLRNIHQTAPFAHNGFFKKLYEITHFYNTRDVPAEGWPPAEVPETVNTEELGNLDLSATDEANLVKFMKTLSDGWWAP